MILIKVLQVASLTLASPWQAEDMTEQRVHNLSLAQTVNALVVDVLVTLNVGKAKRYFVGRQT